MKQLSKEHREILYAKRNRGMVSVDDLSVILNANKADVFRAQIGQPVPDEVYNALETWITRDDQRYWDCSIGGNNEQ